MANLSYEDFRPLRKGEAGYSPTKRQHISPSTGEIIPTSRFQKLAGSSAPSRLTKAEKEGKPYTPKSEKPPSAPKVTPIRGKKGYGPYIKHQRNDKGDIVRTRVNARTTESLRKQVDRVPAGSGVIIHFVDSRTGKKIKAVGHGKNHTAKIDDLRRWADDAQANGMDWDEAFWGAIGETFDLYDDEGNAITMAPAEFTNVIMYTEVA